MPDIVTGGVTPTDTPTTVPDPVSTDPAAPAAEPVAPEAPAPELDEDGNPIPPPTPEPERKFKLKINGKEEDYTESQLLTMAQKYKGADEKFGEAAKMRDEIVDFIKTTKSDPKTLLSKLGIDPRAFAEELLYDVYKEESLPEPERNLLKSQREAAEYKAKLEAIENEKLTAVQAADQARYEQEYDVSITAALSSSSLPKTPGTVKRVIEYLVRGIDQNVAITPEQAVLLVAEDYENEHKELYGNANEDILFKLLGEDKVNKLLGKVKKDHDIAPNRVDPTQPQSAKASRQAKRKTWAQLTAELDERLK